MLFVFQYVANRLYFSILIIPWIWTIGVTAYVCTKERHQPQRDSNPVLRVDHAANELAWRHYRDRQLQMGKNYSILRIIQFDNIKIYICKKNVLSDPQESAVLI